MKSYIKTISFPLRNMSGVDDLVRIKNRGLSRSIVAVLKACPGDYFRKIDSGYPDRTIKAEIKIYDDSTFETLNSFTMKMRNKGRKWLALSPDGNKLAIFTLDPDNRTSLKIFDTNTGQIIRTISSNGRVEQMEFTPDGKRILICDGHRVLEFQIDTGNVKKSWSRDEFGIPYLDIFGASYDAFGKKIMFRCSAGEGSSYIIIVDTKDDTHLRLTNNGRHCALSPDGNKIAIGVGEDIEIRSSENGDLLQTLSPEGYCADVRYLAFSLDNDELYVRHTGYTNEQVDAGDGYDWDWGREACTRVWNLSDGNMIERISAVEEVQFSADGRMWFQTFYDRFLYIHRTKFGPIFNRSRNDTPMELAFNALEKGTWSFALPRNSYFTHLIELENTLKKSGIPSHVDLDYLILELDVEEYLEMYAFLRSNGAPNQSLNKMDVLNDIDYYVFTGKLTKEEGLFLIDNRNHSELMMERFSKGLSLSREEAKENYDYVEWLLIKKGFNDFPDQVKDVINGGNIEEIAEINNITPYGAKNKIEDLDGENKKFRRRRNRFS